MRTIILYVWLFGSVFCLLVSMLMRSRWSWLVTIVGVVILFSLPLYVSLHR